MALVTYDNFLDIAEKLDNTDITNLCSANITFRDYCQRSAFWGDLLHRQYGYTTEQPISEEKYNYIADLHTIPPTEVDDPELQSVFDQIVGVLRQYEVIALLENQPVKSYIINSEYYHQDQDVSFWELQNITFEAYSVFGALLQAYREVLLETGENIIYPAFTDAYFQVVVDITGDMLSEENLDSIATLIADQFMGQTDDPFYFTISSDILGELY